MRKTKFRGRTEDGEFIYGDLLQGNYDESAPKIKPRHKKAQYVWAVSVAQLVGYDTNGKEIYEGDTLIDEKGFTYTAFLQPSVEWEKEKEMKDFFGWHGAPLAVAEQFAKLKLKVSEPCDVD